MSLFHLDRFTVAQRIQAGFALVLLLLLTSALITFRSVSALEAEVAATEAQVRTAEKTSDFERLTNNVRRLSLSYLAFEQGEMLGAFKTGLAGLSAEGDRIGQTAGPEGTALKAAAAAYVTQSNVLIGVIQKRKAALDGLTKFSTMLSNAGYTLAERSAKDPELSFAAYRTDRALQSSIAAADLFRATANPAVRSTAEVEYARYLRELSSLEKLDTEGRLQSAIKAANAKLPNFKTALDGVLGGASEIDGAYRALRQAGDTLVSLGSASRVNAVRQQQLLMNNMSENASGLRSLVLLIGSVAFLIGGLLAWRVGRGVSQPLSALTRAMEQLAAGDHGARVPAGDRRDEMGAMARAVQVFKDALIAKQAADEAAALDAGAKMRRANVLDTLTRTFEANVSTLTQGLAGAANDMETTARSMAGTADQTTHQSERAMGAAEATSENVRTVAAASEEMSASIQEITAQAGQSARIAHQAAEEARRTDTLVQQLSSGAQRIDTIVAMINKIAGQTNLLALNATIEAARAGEAGRGFAVVASEVKELASQTTKATDEIASQIHAIQQATLQSVQAIRGIGATIAEMAQVSTAIASAMDQQGAATQEIARNVQQAASGTAQVTGSIADVRHGAGSTGAAASHVLGAAQELSRHSTSLAQEVSVFLSGVKAA